MSQKPKNTQNDLMERGKELLHQGNIRRIIIRNAEGRVLLDTSLTVATATVLGLAILLPGSGLFLALIAAVGALYARLKIEVVRELGDGDSVVSGRIVDQAAENLVDEEEAPKPTRKRRVIEDESL